MHDRRALDRKPLFLADYLYYLPTAALLELARYDVRTTTELEDLDHQDGRIYTLAT